MFPRDALAVQLYLYLINALLIVLREVIISVRGARACVVHIYICNMYTQRFRGHIQLTSRVANKLIKYIWGEFYIPQEFNVRARLYIRYITHACARLFFRWAIYYIYYQREETLCQVILCARWCLIVHAINAHIIYHAHVNKKKSISHALRFYYHRAQCH